MDSTKVYRGALLQGRKDGYGELFDGTNFYIGFWKNDLPNGDGILVRDLA